MILIMIFGKFTNLKPEMAAFEMAASQTVAILLILNNSNKSNSYFADFEQVKQWLVILLTQSKLKKTDNKTPVGETGCLWIFFQLWPHWLFFFFECLGIQFFNSLTCDLWDTMPRQRSLTFIAREAEDFPRGGNHSKHVPLPTYLA